MEIRIRRRVLLIPGHQDIASVARETREDVARVRPRHHEHASSGVPVLPRRIELVDRPLHRVAGVVLGLEHHADAGEGALAGEPKDGITLLAAANARGRPSDIEDARRPLRGSANEGDDRVLEVEATARARLILAALRLDPGEGLTHLLLELASGAPAAVSQTQSAWPRALEAAS